MQGARLAICRRGKSELRKKGGETDREREREKKKKLKIKTKGLTRAPRVLPVRELVQGKDDALLGGVVDPGLEVAGPLLGRLPVDPIDIRGAVTGRRRGRRAAIVSAAVLITSTSASDETAQPGADAAFTRGRHGVFGAALAAHELEDLARVGGA